MLKKRTNVGLVICAVVVGCVVLAGAVPASATVLVTEPFDYAPGTYGPVANNNDPFGMGSASGIGWGTNEWFSHAGGRTFVITSGATGGYADGPAMNSRTNEWRARVMSPVIPGTAGLVTWQSTTMSTEQGGSIPGWLITGNSNGGYHYAIRSEADNTYGLSGGHGHASVVTSTIPVSTDLNNPDLVLVKLERDPTLNLMDVSMWVNPTATTEGALPAADLTISDVIPFAGNRNIGHINFRPGGLSIDNIIFASAYEDVAPAAGGPIPEPATMCALGLAVAGLGGYVRRRKRS